MHVHHAKRPAPVGYYASHLVTLHGPLDARMAQRIHPHATPQT
jgi:hypothetical protein